MRFNVAACTAFIYVVSVLMFLSCINETETIRSPILKKTIRKRAEIPKYRHYMYIYIYKDTFEIHGPFYVRSKKGTD